MKTKLEELMTNLKLNKFLDREEEKENCKKKWLLILAIIGGAALIGTAVFFAIRKFRGNELEDWDDEFDEEDFFDDLEDEADEIKEEAAEQAEEE